MLLRKYFLFSILNDSSLSINKDFILFKIFHNDSQPPTNALDFVQDPLSLGIFRVETFRQNRSINREPFKIQQWLANFLYFLSISRSMAEAEAIIPDRVSYQPKQCGNHTLFVNTSQVYWFTWKNSKCQFYRKRSRISQDLSKMRPARWKISTRIFTQSTR